MFTEDRDGLHPAAADGIFSRPQWPASARSAPDSGTIDLSGFEGFSAPAVGFGPTHPTGPHSL